MYFNLVGRHHSTIYIVRAVAVLLAVACCAPVLAAPPSSPISTSCASGDMNSNGVTDYDDATLNEIKSKGGGPAPIVEFVEIKVLQSDVDISGWQMCFSTMPTKENCTDMGTGNGTWYTTTQTTGEPDDGGPDSGNPTTYQSNTWVVYDALNIRPEEGEAIIFDNNGDVIDYIRWSNNAGICTDSNKHWDVPAACGACFDGRDPSQKDFARVPDGSGDFVNNDDTPTEGTSNDPFVSAVDHYSISLSTTAGVTCDTVEVTITVHDSNHAAVDPGGSTLLTLSASNGTDNRGSWVGIVSGTGILSDPALGDGVATYTFPAGGGETSVTLQFAYTNPLADPDSINFGITDGSFTEQTGVADAGDDPLLSMASAGFIFYNATDASKILPTQIAGKPSNVDPDGRVLQLRAVRSSDDVTQCIGLFPGGANAVIELGAECKDPATCAGVQLNVNSIPIATGDDNSDDAGADDAPAYTAVTLGFNADSIADIILLYNDVGQLQLHGRYDLGNPAAAYMQGNSSFFVRPFALYLDDVKRTADGFANPAASGPGGTAFVKAGDGATAESRFNARVSAVVWQSADDDGMPSGIANDGIPDDGSDLSDNPVTPNFGNENIPETVTLSHTLVDPAGGSAGSLANGLYSNFATSGVQAISNLAWSEVGIISLAPAITDADYLGLGNLPVTVEQDNVGRFYPDHFNVTTSATGSFADSCGSFTYMGQSFHYNVAPAINIEARSTTAATTNNYDLGYNQALTLARSAVHGGAAVNASFSMLTGGGVAISGLGAGDGSMTLTLATASAGDSFLYDRIAALQPQFSADVDLTFASAGLTDTDGVCYDQANGNSCNSYTISTIGSSEQRFGRFVLENAFGSENAVVPIIGRTEYYYDDGTDIDFIINSDDSCTSYNSANLSFISLTPTVTGSGIVAAGVASGMSADNGGSAGTDTMTLDFGAAGLDEDWLQYDWNGDGNHDNNPDADITFGIFNRSRNIIYSREPW